MNTLTDKVDHLADDLKKISDLDLHHRMLVTSEKERQLTAQMISMIEEAGRRKFYLDLGFATLFDYLTQGLKYSAGSAMRRIGAAKIAREIPDVKDRILEGSLSLSNISQAEQFFRNEEKYSQGLNLEKKREVLNQMENKSTRECEKILIALSSVPEQLKEDKIKPLTPTLTEITFKADVEFMAHLEEAKGLLAHQMPDATLSDVMAEVMRLAVAGLKKKKFKVADIEAKEIEPLSQGTLPNPVSSEPVSKPARHNKALGYKTSGSFDGRVENTKYIKLNEAVFDSMTEKPEDPTSVSSAGSKSAKVPQNSRFIPAAVRREVFRRDRGRCTVVNPRTGKVCASRFRLEFDHFPLPWAMGGPSTTSNLRLACTACNRLCAVARYGKDKIANKINRI